MENNVNNNELNVAGNNIPQPQTFDNQNAVVSDISQQPVMPMEQPVVPQPVAPMPVVEATVDNANVIEPTIQTEIIQPVVEQIVQEPVISTPVENIPVTEVPVISPEIPNPVNIESVSAVVPMAEVQPMSVEEVVVPVNVPDVQPVVADIPTSETTIEVQTTMNPMPEVGVVHQPLMSPEQPVIEETNVQPIVEQPTIDHPAETSQSVITPSPDMAAPSEVLSPKPLDEVTAVPETFGMAAYYKPVVDFSRENATEEVPTPEAPGAKVELNPIAEAPGMANQSLKPEKIKKGNKKIIFIIVGLLLAVAIAVGVYFLFFDKDKEEEKTVEEPKELAWDEKRPDWDSSTSKIKMSGSATKLTCTYEEPLEEMTNKITYTHLYENDIYTQVVVEDEIQFTEGTIQYYDYYVGSGEEEVEYQSEMYDNITIEVREKKTSVSIAYSFDLTASNENPKNMLDDKDLTKDEMKLKMEGMGFVCK